MFAYHGYPWLIHRLTYRRTNHDNIHVRGYKEEGTTTTPFDMVMLNDLDRFHLVIDVIDRVPASATAPVTSGRRWRTPGSARGPTPATWVRTSRRSAAGAGRLLQTGQSCKGFVKPKTAASYREILRLRAFYLRAHSCTVAEVTSR